MLTPEEIKKINVREILRGKFPEDQFAMMAEVSDAAGHYRSNSADFIAVGLWPSRGLNVYGIELKSYRSDWLNELKKPKKAENIFQFCDFFWLLTIDDTIAKAEEIPTTWGWMAIKNGKIKVLKEAPKLIPLPVDRHFMAAMLKRAVDKSKYVHQDSLDAKIDELVTIRAKSAMYQVEDLKRQLESLNKNVREFEEASGVTIRDTWGDMKKTGAIVKIIKNNDLDGYKNELNRIKNTLSNMMERIQEAHNKLSDNGN